MNISNSNNWRSFFAQKWTDSQKSTARLVAVGGLLSGALALGLIGISQVGGHAAQATSPSASNRATTAEVIHITKSDTYAIQHSFTGTLVASRTSDLSFELSGKVINVLVDEGARVRANQTLALLDTRHIKARQAQVQAQRDQAAAVLAELVAGPRSEDIAAARAEVRQLQADFSLQESNRSRRANLLVRNVISQEEFDASAYGAGSAKARLEAAQRRLDELLAGTRKEQIDAQQATVAQLDATLADIQLQLEDAILVAPYSGSISARRVDEGSVVSAGQAIFRVVEDGQLEAWFGLPPEVAADVSVGDVYEIDVAGAKHSATVRGVLPELDRATRTRSAILLVAEEASSRLVPAQVARLQITRKRPQEGFSIPNTALVRGARGLWSVFAVGAENTVQRRDVEVLSTGSDQSFVRGTLADGDRIVANGVHRLAPGQAVEPITKQ